MRARAQPTLLPLYVQVFVFLLWDALLLLGVYVITVHFGSQFWREQWYLPVAAAGAAAVSAEGGWATCQLRRERRGAHPLPTNADATAGLLASSTEEQPSGAV